MGIEINMTPTYSGKKKINLEDGLSKMQAELTNNDTSDVAASSLSKMLSYHRMADHGNSSLGELPVNTSMFSRKVPQGDSSYQ